MRRLSAWLSTIAALLLASPTVRAAELELRWQAVDRDVEGARATISHYLLYLGRSPRPADVSHPSDGLFGYERVIHAGPRTQQRVDDLPPGTWFFAVAAVDTEGNLSDYSREVSLGLPDEQGKIPPARAAPAVTAKGSGQPPSSGCASAGPGLGFGWSGAWCLLGFLRARRFNA